MARRAFVAIKKNKMYPTSRETKEYGASKLRIVMCLNPKKIGNSV
jgi:hypothetical protein